MDCKNVKKRLSAYIDGELDRKEVPIVKEHIDSCSNCSKLLYEYKKSWEMLGAWDGIEPSKGYVSNFWTKVTSQPSWSEGVIQVAKNIMLQRRFAYRIATILLIILTLNIAVFHYVSEIKTRTIIINMSEEEWEMIENFDLIANLNVLENPEEF